MASIAYRHNGEMTLYETPPTPEEKENVWHVYELDESLVAAARAKLMESKWTATSHPLEYTQTSDFYSTDNHQANVLLQILREWPQGSWVSQLPIRVVQLPPSAPSAIPVQLREARPREGIEINMVVPCTTIDGEDAELDLLSFARRGWQRCDGDSICRDGDSVKVFPRKKGRGKKYRGSTWVHVPAQAWLSAIEHARQVGEVLNLGGWGRSTFPRASLLSERTRASLETIVGGDRLIARTTAAISGILAAKTDDRPNWPMPCFKGTLRPFQVAAVNWGMAAIEAGFGGLIADERGLGKTVETLALIAARRAVRKKKKLGRSPTVIVVERKDLDHWRRKILEFVPALKTTYVASGVGLSLDHLEVQDILLVTYTVFRNQATSSLLAKLKAELVFLDEALVAKNPRSGTWEAFDKQANSLIFPITGTPIDRNTNDLWALLELATPGLFTREKFAELCNKGTVEATRELRDRMAPFVLRRLKKDVAKDLPPKHEIIQFITLEREHAIRYEAQRREASRDWQQISRTMRPAQAQVALERRVLDGLRRAAGPVAAAGSKLSHLTEMLTELVANGDRILLFSEFNETVEFLSSRLRECGLRAMTMLGDPEKRDRALAGFKEGRYDILSLSVRLGASGLDVPEATVVVVYDPWLNIGKMDQMGDRAHRLVTTHEVSVYWLVSADTVESAAIEVLAEGQQNADAILDGDPEGAGVRWYLDDSDVDALLAITPAKE